MDRAKTDPSLLTGKTGALTTASGLKIGWIGGKYDEAKYATEEEQVRRP